MDIPRPGEGDVNIGTDTFRACWALTGIVGVILSFRFATKAWVRCSLPQVSAPERVWGLEDFLFLLAFSLDVTQMILIEMSYHWGLGRHFYYLGPEERAQSMKFDFASQPTAVAAAMISRTGMMWFLYQCFANSNWRLRLSIVICMIVQIVVNSVTIIQIVVQCGPSPYRPSNRTQYFHYMWDPLPADGSVVCQSPSVQTTIGFVQGGFNSIIDFSLAGFSAFELWQFFIQTLDRNPRVSIWTQFLKINPSVRSRRIWQTLTLSGPLVVSGVASIVKTYLLKSLGDRLDFTYNIVPFILFVKIENYSILIATCAPVIRLFLRTFVDQRRDGRYQGYFWNRSSSSNNSRGYGLKKQKKQGSTTRVVSAMDEENTAIKEVFPDRDFLCSAPGSSHGGHDSQELQQWDQLSGRSDASILKMHPVPSLPNRTNNQEEAGVKVKTDNVIGVDKKVYAEAKKMLPFGKNRQQMNARPGNREETQVERHAGSFSWRRESEYLA